MLAKFSEFVELLGGCYDDDEKSELLSLFDSLIGDKQAFIGFLEDVYGFSSEDIENWMSSYDDSEYEYEDEEEAEYSRRLNLSHDVCLLLREFVYIYNDDWKMDYESLSEYIAEGIDQEFEVTFEQCKTAFDESDGEVEPADVIRQKIEQQSDFTLLQLISGNDDVNFAIVQKADKAKILTLTDELGFIAM